MWRAATGATAVVVLSLSPLLAADEQPTRGTIVGVNVGKGTVTVKIGNRDGKEVERIFHFGARFQPLSETGAPINISVFRPGDVVRFRARDGQLRELRRERRANRLERKEERKRSREK